MDRDTTDCSPLPVTVLWSPEDWRASWSRAVVGSNPRALLVEYDATSIGNGQCVRRTTAGDGRQRRETVPNPRHCLACLLRDDLLPHLARLVEQGRCDALACVIPSPLELLDLLTLLPDARLDGRPVSSLVDFGDAVVVLDAACLSRAVPVSRGPDLLPGSLFRQVVAADVVAIDGPFDASQQARVRALIGRCNPAAWQLQIDGAHGVRVVGGPSSRNYERGSRASMPR